MWWSDRRTIAAGLLAALALAGCGFSPAYAPGGTGERLQGQLLAEAPTRAKEFAFVSRLEQRIGRSDAAPFALSYEIDTDDVGLAITPDQQTLRYHLTGRVDYRVSDRATGEVLASGRVESFTSYSAIGTTVATRASETDAETRLMTILADQLVTRLLASGGSWLP